MSSAKSSENPSSRNERSTPSDGAQATRSAMASPASMVGARLTNAAKRPAGKSARSQPGVLRSKRREIGPAAQLPRNESASSQEIIEAGLDRKSTRLNSSHVK